MQAAMDTVVALVNQAGADTIYLRTGGNLNGTLDVFIDNIKSPLRAIRLLHPVTIDYSYHGQRFIVKGSIGYGPTPNSYVLQGFSTDDLVRIHQVYGDRVRALLGPIDNLLVKLTTL